tara:strand:+ start:84 stop:452 length:369 start_codon:yes stop_codon:yes gene_type:complete
MSTTTNTYETSEQYRKMSTQIRDLKEALAKQKEKTEIFKIANSANLDQLASLHPNVDHLEGLLKRSRIEVEDLTLDVDELRVLLERSHKRERSRSKENADLRKEIADLNDEVCDLRLKRLQS